MRQGGLAGRRTETRLSRPNRRWACGLVSALLVFAGLQGCGAEPSVALANGGSLRFSELTGQWVFINYWAEWCAPCREEIPELNDLYAHQFNQGAAVPVGNTAVRVHGGDPNVTVLGVNYDAIQGEKLVDVIARMDIRFPVLTEDPRDRWGYAQPDVLPTTVVIGPDGKLRDQLYGPQTVETLLAATRQPG